MTRRVGAPRAPFAQTLHVPKGKLVNREGSTRPDTARANHPAELHQIASFNHLDLYHRSPNSGERVRCHIRLTAEKGNQSIARGD